MALINTSPLVKTYTLEEFWELPDPPDRAKLELIAGVLYMSPPPGYIHDDIVTRLIRVLTMELVRVSDRGKLHAPRAAIWTSPNTYLEPDLFYISAETRARLNPAHRTTADLVIEVISPGSAIYDRNTKADTYAALGVKELWLVDEVEENIELRRLTDVRFGPGKVFTKGETVTSELLSGLTVDASSIFAD
ncbi:MAG: Uma2 family endonuclease [Pyrinomonadaceae bacterium]